MSWLANPDSNFKLDNQVAKAMAAAPTQMTARFKFCALALSDQVSWTGREGALLGLFKKLCWYLVRSSWGGVMQVTFFCGAPRKAELRPIFIAESRVGIGRGDRLASVFQIINQIIELRELWRCWREMQLGAGHIISQAPGHSKLFNTQPSLSFPARCVTRNLS